MSRSISPDDLDAAIKDQRAAQLKNWRIVVSDFVAGVPGALEPRLAILCDSTGRGVASTADATQFQNGWPAQLAKILTGLGLPTRDDNLSNSGIRLNTAITDFTALDNRFTFTGPVSLAAISAPFALGGKPFQLGANSKASHQPKGYPFDTIKIWYLAHAGFGSATVDVDGGAALGTIDPTQGTLGLRSATFTCVAGMHTINVSTVAGGFVLMGYEVTLSTAPKVQILNLSCSSWRTADIPQPAVQTYDAINALALYKIHLAIIDCIINDVSDVTDPVVWASKIQAQGNAVVAQGGDVILKTSTWTNQAAAAERSALMTQLFGLAVLNNWMVIDTASRQKDYATLAAMGMNSGDGTHPNRRGYADIAKPAVSALWLDL